MLKSLEFYPPLLVKRKRAYVSSVDLSYYCRLQSVPLPDHSWPTGTSPGNALPCLMDSYSVLLVSLGWECSVALLAPRPGRTAAVLSSGFTTPNSDGCGSGHPHINLYHSARKVLFTLCQGLATLGLFSTLNVITELPGSLTDFLLHLPCQISRGFSPWVRRMRFILMTGFFGTSLNFVPHVSASLPQPGFWPSTPPSCQKVLAATEAIRTQARPYSASSRFHRLFFT